MTEPLSELKEACQRVPAAPDDKIIARGGLKTLVQGWWGIISFFVNFVAVGTDIAALRRASKLGEPQGASTSVAQREQSEPRAHGLQMD